MTNEQHLTVQGAYEQIVKSHHFYLKWRHGALAGYFVIVGVLVAAAGRLREHDLMELLWLVCAAASGFNAASRLESLNKEHKSHIIISESTKKQLTGSVRVKDLGEVQVRGREEPIRIFEVLAD